MQRATVIALILAPILGPAIYWLLGIPGRALVKRLRQMPPSRLRRLLLRDVD